MTPAVKEEAQAKPLEEEFAELQAEERELKQRLEKSQIATLVTAFVALIIALVATVVALSNKNNDATVVMRGPTPGTTARQPAAGMGPGMMGSASPSVTRTVNVALGEMFVRPNATSITAGKVTFVARNMGQVTHELMIEKSPIKMEGPGKPVEDAALGMVDDMQPGGTGKLSVKLTPGTYELFCNVPGHYAAGQRTTFTVTKG